MTKLCKECRHSIKDEQPIWSGSRITQTSSPTWWQCRLTRTTSPVDGSDAYQLCSVTRVTPSQCGPDGKWFEPDPHLVDQEPPDQYNRPSDAESQL